MSTVRVYTTKVCAYCEAAKRLLRARGVPYVEQDVTGDAATREWLMGASGQRTVPQIFIGERSVGGYRELVALAEAGGLDALAGEPRGSAAESGDER